MNATVEKPPAAKPAPPPDAIPATRPDAAACAQSLRVEGTLPAAQWGAVLDGIAAEIQRRNGIAAAKRAAATTKRWVVAVLALVAAGATGFFLGGELAIVVFIAGVIATFVVVRMPPVDVIGAERLGFVRELVDEFAMAAGKARLGLKAQLDARRAIDDRPLEGGSGNARSQRTREEGWLRGELSGLPGLYLGWSVTEWHTLTRVRKRNARGRTKTKAKLAIARRFNARLDADGALFRSAVSRSGGSMQPQGLVEVRETPKGWSVRGRHEYQGKFALHHPDDLGASLEELRKGTGYKGRDREDVFGQYASTLIYLMKQCEQKLQPHLPEGAKR